MSPFSDSFAGTGLEVGAAHSWCRKHAEISCKGSWFMGGSISMREER